MVIDELANNDVELDKLLQARKAFTMARQEIEMFQSINPDLDPAFVSMLEIEAVIRIRRILGTK